MSFSLRRIIRLSPEALWVFSGQMGAAVAGLLGVKLLTHVLNPAEYGRLALANTIVSLIVMNLFGPLGQGFTRFWAISEYRDELSKFYLITSRYTKFIFFIVFFIAVILSFIFGVTKGINWSILLTLSLIVGGITGWLNLRISIFTAIRQRKCVALLDIGSALFRPIIATILIVLIASNANWAMVGYLLAALLMLLIAEYLYSRTISGTCFSFLVKKQPIPLLQGLGREILTFSWPFFAWGIFGWVHTSCDRWALQAYYGADVVGAFAVISLLAVYPLSSGSSFLSNLFTPIAFQQAGDLSSLRSVGSANKILIAVTVTYIAGATILIVLFVVFHHPLVLLISNVNFVKYSYLLAGLTAAWSLFYLGQILSSFGMLANKPHKYILPKLISGIIAGIGTFYLSATMGPVGVVWALAVAGFIYAQWCFIIAVQLVIHTGVKKDAIANAQGM